MAGFPYELPGTMPAAGVTGWDVPLEANQNDLRDRIRIHEAAYGVPLDAFPGADDERLAAATAYAAAQTRPPAIILGSRAHTFSAGPYPYYPGLRLIGSLGHVEREFATTGPHTVVTVGGTALFSVPIGGVKNMYISGIQFRAASGSVHFQAPVTDLAAGPLIQDATFEKLAWVGFSTVMHARHLRCRIGYTYTNNGTDHQFKLGGSDNEYWPDADSYLSSTQLAANKYYIWFTHMSRTHVGGLYLTPERATGVRVDGSFGGLNFTGMRLDSTGRTQTTACQGAALLVTGGRGLVFDKLWLFNNAVNPSATGRSPQDKGQIYVRGDASDLLFTSCQFGGGDAQTSLTPAGTPGIYAASGVSNVKVVAPIAPAGGIKVLQHQSGGIISKYAADDWTLSVA